MQELNLWAVLVAALSSFASGGLWFSPLAFGRIQAREMLARGSVAPPATPAVIAASFLLTLVEALAFAWLSGTSDLQRSMTLALVVGGCFAATSTAINYLYTGRGIRLTLVDAGYHLVRFLVYGLVLGLWRQI
jgi:hypothetical protein